MSYITTIYELQKISMIVAYNILTENQIFTSKQKTRKIKRKKPLATVKFQNVKFQIVTILYFAVIYAISL